MASSTLIKSLTRLYESGRLTKEDVGARVTKGTITPEEFKKITGEDHPASAGEQTN